MSEITETNQEIDEQSYADVSPALSAMRGHIFYMYDVESNDPHECVDNLLAITDAIYNDLVGLEAERYRLDNELARQIIENIQLRNMLDIDHNKAH